MKQLPTRLQPRKKALIGGLHTLNDIELLALFIRSGKANHGVLSVASNLLSSFGTLSSLSKASVADLIKYEGVGSVKALEINALFEFAKRIKFEEDNNIELRDPEEARNLAINLISDFKQEHFIVLFLDNEYKMIQKKVLYKGTTQELAFDPKDVVSLALKLDAKRYYCFHNHPSGDVHPSGEDISSTKRLQHYSEIFGIEMIAHLVLNKKGDYFPIGI